MELVADGGGRATSSGASAGSRERPAGSRSREVSGARKRQRRSLQTASWGEQDSVGAPLPWISAAGHGGGGVVVRRSSGEAAHGR